MHAKGNPLRVRVERGIYKRTTREGVVRYEVAFSDSDARQRWRTVATLREARLLRAELVTRVDRGERVAPTRVTLAEYAEAWLERQEPRLRPRTLDLYRSALRLHVLPRLGRRRLADVTVDDVADLMSSMQRGVRFVERDGRTVEVTGAPFAAWTIRGAVAVLGRVLGSAARSGALPANPVRRLERGERPKIVRRAFPSLDREAIGRLIASTPDRYRVLVAVSVLTGLRQGEALGLRWADVDVKAGELHVRGQLGRDGRLVVPKTDAAIRDIPIAASLARMLAEHKLASDHSADEDFVFSSETGGPMHHRNVVRRGLDPALAAAGLGHLRWHDLRHLAASALIETSEGDADHVSRVLGHANASITLSVYAQSFEKVKRADRMRERMEAAYGELLR